MKQKTILWAAGIVGVCALAFVWYRRSGASELQGALIEYRAHYTIKAMGDGQLLAGDERYLTLRKGGNLETLRVKLGNSVQAGQVLAVVDETKNAAALRSALSDYRFAGSDLSRIQRLVGLGAATAQELDDIRSRYATKQAGLETARQNLEESVVRSPIDGVVSFLAFRTGDFVPDGSRILVVEDRSTFQATIRVPVSYRGQLPAKSNVTLAKRSTSAADSSSGASVEVLAQIDNASPESDFDALNMDIRCRIASLPPNFNLRDLVRVEIPVREVQNVALLEKRALQRAKGKTTVLLLGSNGLVGVQEVKVEAEDGTRFVVTGMPEKAQVVLPTPGLRPEQLTGKKARLSQR